MNEMDNTTSEVVEEIKPKKRKSSRSVLKEILELSIYFLVVLIISLLIITFVAQRTIVAGASMEPTLANGDNLVVDKISYRFKEPKRFDIIVFPYRLSKNTYYIKRIIGLPGETVQIGDNGAIYINGEVLEENYGKEVIEPQKRGRAEDAIVLGDDEYFVMGDNRNNSSDSRYMDVGNIKRSDIIGKTWIRVYPLKDFGWIKHQ